MSFLPYPPSLPGAEPIIAPNYGRHSNHLPWQEFCLSQFYFSGLFSISNFQSTRLFVIPYYDFLLPQIAISFSLNLYTPQFQREALRSRYSIQRNNEIELLERLGGSLRHIRNLSEEADSHVVNDIMVYNLSAAVSMADHVQDDLGSARRELITTIDPGRDRRNAGEFARLERMQRVNEGRQTAIQEGWFSKF